MTGKFIPNCEADTSFVRCDDHELQTIKFLLNDKEVLIIREDGFEVNGVHVDPKTPEEGREIIDLIKKCLR